jgi:hypothetical protein
MAQAVSVWRGRQRGKTAMTVSEHT